MRFSAVPPLGPIPALAPPPMADERLPGGLRIVAARYPSIPMVEVRLAIPRAPATSRDVAAQELLTATLLHGTPTSDRREITDRLADAGATLAASRTSRWLILTGSGPADKLPVVLAVLADCLTHACHPESAVQAARDLAVHRAVAARTEPHMIASETLLRRLYGRLPAMQDVPEPADLAAVTAGDLRRAHREVVRPSGAVLVLVGDLEPLDAVEAVDRMLRIWRAVGPPSASPPTPVIRRHGVVRVRRHNATQSQIRLVRPAIGRDDPGFVALSVANVVFGGYFSSRLFADIREGRGLAYRCESTIRDHLDQPVIAVEADTMTARATETLHRIHDQMRQMAIKPPTSGEVEAVRRYSTGMTALSVSSQHAWAGELLTSLILGQEPQHVQRLLDRLATIDADAVAEAASRFYDPDDYHGIVLGGAADHPRTEGPR